MAEKSVAELVREALEKLRMRLLDLTSRNRLINFRHTKRSSLRIIDELPNQLVETLLADKEMRFLPVSEPTREALIKNGYIEIDEQTGEEIVLKKEPTAEEWAKVLGFDTSYELPKANTAKDDGRHQDNAIQTLFYPYELETRLRSLTQMSNLAIQEMGANILYIAFGFLEWSEYGNENARLAPLFLLPIRLEKGKLNKKTNAYEYTLRYSGEELIPNISLREKLRVDFGLNLPELDEAVEPELYFNRVSRIIKGKPSWSIRRYASVALLNFSKMLMYLDLDPENWPDDANILDHPLIMKFLAGYSGIDNDEEAGYENLGFGEEYLIDELKDVHTKYPLIDDADSSQHSALVDAIGGKDLVIEGPPGTGKSQTITNLIAAAISQGKKVLFVAEKLAALEVVRRRLDAANLGDFCLELHSHKSQKRKVLDELDVRLENHGYYRRPSNIDVCIDGYEKNKEILKKHADGVNEGWKSTGKTVHEILMAAARFRAQTTIEPNVLHLDRYDGDTLTPAVQRQTTDQVEAYRKVYQSLVERLPNGSKLLSHPWYGIKNSDLQFLDLEKILSALGEWQHSLDELKKEGINLAVLLEVEPDVCATSARDLADLAEDIDSLPTLVGDELLTSLSRLEDKGLSQANEFLELFLNIEEGYGNLSNEVPLEVLQELSSVDELVVESKNFEGLLNSDVKVSDLADFIGELKKVRGTLTNQKDALEHVASKLPPDAAKHLVPTPVGYNEFSCLVSIVAELDIGHWRLREECFDNEELDQLLPLLRKDLEHLSALHDAVGKQFQFDRLPDNEQLLAQNEILNNAGAFHWLKGDWRSARKSVLSYAKNPKTKLAALHPLLTKAANYLKSKKAFDENESYKRALGEHLKFLDTDLHGLESLRSWYRKIRANYGIGFGEKVALGDAILTLPDDLGPTVRSLAEQNTSTEIDAALKKLEELAEVFKPAKEFRKTDALLVGNVGVIPGLVDSLDRAFSCYRRLATDGELTISTISDRVTRLAKLKQLKDKWSTSNVDVEMFDGKLALDPGVNKDNQSSLSMLRNTLGLAGAVEELTSRNIKDYIYRKQDKSTFSDLKAVLNNLQAKVDHESKAMGEFADMVKLDVTDWVGSIDSTFNQLGSRNKHALDNGETLSNWLEYLRMREQLIEDRLEKLVVKIESGSLDVGGAEDAHKAGMFDMLAREIMQERRQISRFSGRTQETVQDKFRMYDDELKLLQQKQLASNTAKVRIPDGTYGARVNEHTERNLIVHELNKQKRHIPIRQLLRRASSAIIAMKPCLMMGPMSVAQYLKPGQFQFDLVVMDEASQIKPEDAIGAIARGKQLVVVGDPKQLPPTSFFDRVNKDDDDEVAAIEESESILDATLPIFSARRLRWHYRSQHESLIAFSNHSFYDSDLVLFPSPHAQSEEYGIQYTVVPDGCFVNRRNMEEAKFVSKAVRDHFLKHSDESIGVVAMNVEQREQIERAIETLTKEDEEFRRKLEENEGSYESLFVKNLENVQGDERDVILISMTYGPQEPRGRVMQRFGPINSDVGWRRLNVLFTRSKKRMCVFSSMSSNDIVIGPQAKRGVHAMRDFLNYCETGILAKTIIDSERGPDSDFEIAVMDALSKKGFECVPQVGVAGFFIDLAVKDPGSPGRYLIGIECDGATYHSAKSTRDRDRLRQTILERLGWRIRRIWSTDWFNNPNAELKPIVDELNKLKSEIKDEYEPEPDQKVERDDISEIDEERVDHFALVSTATIIQEQAELENVLSWLDEEEIKKNYPDTPAKKRLLRPAMLEAIVEYKPTNKTEFLEFIPGYLREATAPEEGKYLDQVFEIVNASLAIEEHDPPMAENDYSAGDVAEAIEEKEIPKDGEQVEKLMIQRQLHALREKIWEETGTEPDKFGILKRSLVEKYLESPVTTQDDWEAMLGHETQAIHESHKKYLPEIFLILSRLKK